MLYYLLQIAFYFNLQLLGLIFQKFWELAPEAGEAVAAQTKDPVDGGWTRLFEDHLGPQKLQVPIKWKNGS